MFTLWGDEMLTARECEKKFKEIRAIIERLPETETAKERIKHLERLREAYAKEFHRAIEREVK